jgi:hypothetical protein
MAASAGERSEVLRGLLTQRQRSQQLEVEVHRQARRLGLALPPLAVGFAAILGLLASA